MKKIKEKEIGLILKNQVIDTGPSEIIEKFLDVSEIENEKANSLVRIDINVIEYPLFTKNPRRKKNQIIRYFFNRDKEAYIQVNPTSGDCIPGEFEERVFIAILKIMRDKRYNNIFYTNTSEILYNMGISQTSFKSFYGKVAVALQRLSQTSYIFKNSLYSNKLKGIVDDKINTNIMNIRTISLKQASHEETEYFHDKRIKEIIKISISNHFYDNIIRKGYLVYDSQLLLNMESPITRALYMLINKLRFNRYDFKVLALSLIKKIPLSDDSKSIGRSIKSIERSCQELKKMDLIGDYRVLKNGKLIQSEFEFFFEERHNSLKQNYFFDDKNHFDNLIITHTDAGGLIDISISEDLKNVSPTDQMVETIMKNLPARAKELKTMPKAIKDAIRQYGFDYVKLVAEYMRSQKVGNIRSYFMQALNKGWADDYISKDKIPSDKNSIQELKLFSDEDLNKSKERESLYSNYLGLSDDERLKIEETVYIEYIKTCGMEGKAQKIAFKAGKELMIKEYLLKNHTFEEKSNLTVEPDLDIKTNIFIKKEYENISNFQMELLDVLESMDSNDQVKILKIVSASKYFDALIGNKHIKIEYVENGESSIEIIGK
ncbi:hypothetical protein H3N56_10805 [Cetobacterium sp. 2A]|uniref:hypothetical protein n=1 Tax=Cetobacterium sp. 2A TaxID=2754723 RepID=UPI00163CCE10|nr:hypothetical protein [Cetobacterium sp. 2A]MBC2856922.1 hypothetical protein [Cetobacterium sp. 2A]